MEARTGHAESWRSIKNKVDLQLRGHELEEDGGEELSVTDCRKEKACMRGEL